MKDVVVLKAKGSTLRFLISPAVQEKLNIGHKDVLQILIYGIFDENRKMEIIEPKIPIPNIVRRDGSSIYITIHRDKVKSLKLKEDQMLAIEIEK